MDLSYLQRSREWVRCWFVYSSDPRKL